jgi:hypothetical protein
MLYSKVLKLYRKDEARFFETLALVFSFIFISMQLLLVYWRLFPQIRVQPFIPLHYNIHSGVDLVGAWWQIFMLPFIGFLILVFNFVAGKWVDKRDKKVGVFYSCVTILNQVILFIAMIFVVAINLSYYG